MSMTSFAAPSASAPPVRGRRGLAWAAIIATVAWGAAAALDLFLMPAIIDFTRGMGVVLGAIPHAVLDFHQRMANRSGLVLPAVALFTLVTGWLYGRSTTRFTLALMMVWATIGFVVVGAMLVCAAYVMAAASTLGNPGGL
ncbi:MAG: hypothetical protein ACOYN0_01180 [Phycisphaerales bacterium]